MKWPEYLKTKAKEGQSRRAITLPAVLWMYNKSTRNLLRLDDSEVSDGAVSWGLTKGPPHVPVANAKAKN